MRTILLIFLAGMITGCNKPAPTAQAPQPEYTNSIAGELLTQKKLADWAYEYGKAEQLIADQREKFGQDIDKGLNAPDYSRPNMERQAEETFWYLQTNAEARARVVTDK